MSKWVYGDQWQVYTIAEFRSLVEAQEWLWRMLK